MFFPLFELDQEEYSCEALPGKEVIDKYTKRVPSNLHSMSIQSTKKILITGTSTGVGAALAISLAKKGHTVWATMRNLDKSGTLREGAKEAGVAVTVAKMDVENLESVNACVAEMVASTGSIDVLINNAGAGFIRTVEQATEDEVNWVMNVNFNGVVRTTKAVTPLMRAARKGHIINVSSVGGLVGQPFNELYCASKFAVEGFTESMASYMEPAFGIKFTIVEPGGIATEFASSVLKQAEGTGGIRKDEYAPLIGMYMAQRNKREQGEDAKDTAGVFQTAQEVADVIVTCVENPQPPLRVRTSPWAEKFCSLKTSADPDGKKLQNEVAMGVLGAKSSSELK